jgi:hypothetical protein
MCQRECCHSHAKVVTLALAAKERLSIEGSANLCGNGSSQGQRTAERAGAPDHPKPQAAPRGLRGSAPPLQRARW